MEGVRFEWNERKNRTNIGNRRVSFEEARSAFHDPYAIRFFDPDPSSDEDRFLLLGMSVRLRVLVVCHAFRGSERVVRIFSARKGDKTEVRDGGRRRT